MKKQELTLEQAKELVYKLQQKQHRKKKKELEPVLKNLIGKCYTFSNSYGNGKNWLMYFRVDKAEYNEYHEADLVGFVFQKPHQSEKHFTYEIDPNYRTYLHHVKNEIPREQFDKAYSKILRELKDYNFSSLKRDKDTKAITKQMEKM